ncbi:FAD-dependent oxidoreductase [Kutzneria buriramensis]|uniref:Putative NAD(P)-binding protein n=1 Tax=Kutzneria buriramensis TaxID=1045776 RepID=A0A3E0G5L5_9PSEU|nr:FAD-dependent oxidoreductase [Kutzneria buriramensis]REH17878.1 putative NAD(P)-binding protein [Kutzneria buriramensis]
MRESTQAPVRRELDEGLPGYIPPRSVVVVGAGLAGLATAYELSRRGCEVTVLEAADRPGGQAYTLRHPFADGMHVEAGAMTITPHCHYVAAIEALLESFTEPTGALAAGHAAACRGRQPSSPLDHDHCVKVSTDTPGRTGDSVTGGCAPK